MLNNRLKVQVGLILIFVVLLLVGMLVNKNLPIGLVVEETNQVPVWSSEETKFVLEKNGKLELNLNDYFTDTDSAELTYLATTTDGIEIGVNEAVLTIIPNQDFVGERLITVIASDGNSLTKQQIKIEIGAGEIAILDETSAVSQETQPTSAEVKEAGKTEKVIQHTAVINKPVKWTKKVLLNEAVPELVVSIPEHSTNVTVYEIMGEVKEEIREEKIKVKRGTVEVPLTDNLITGRTVARTPFTGSLITGGVAAETTDTNSEANADSATENVQEQETQEEDSQEVTETTKEPVLSKESNEQTGENDASSSADQIAKEDEQTSESINEEIISQATEQAAETIQEQTTSPENIPIEEGTIALLVEEPVQEVEVEYYTEAPEAFEEEIDEHKKRITIYSEIHYENVLAYTTISDTPKERIRLYRVTEGIPELTEITSYQDNNGDGLTDYIEWIVPSLSNQTYEVIIEITKAEHLDQKREFISGIYDEVKALDDVWSETIPPGDYVRVYFETNLNSQNDITIYPRIINGNPKIKIYEINENELIAEFKEIKPNEYNKVFLTELKGMQDKFDLHVIGGSVEFDHIIDPVAGPTGGLRAFACQAADAESTADIYPDACDGTYPGVCGAGADLVSCNDGASETQTFAKSEFAGVNITSFNASIMDCTFISKVEICYEWWVSGGTLTNCLIEVDANGGASESTVSSTCPGATADPGVTCADVTSLESWQCINFFTVGGQITGGLVSNQVSRSSGGQADTLTTDVLYFNVTYGTGPSCGDDINESKTMDASVTASPSQDCFNITAHNVTLDCAGFSISGNLNSLTAIRSLNKRNVTIKNCNIAGPFSVFVNFTNTSNSLLFNNTASGGAGPGAGIGIILVNNSVGNAVNLSTLDSLASAILVLNGSDNNNITRSDISLDESTIGINVTDSHNISIRDVIVNESGAVEDLGVTIVRSRSSSIVNLTLDNVGFGMVILGSNSTLVENSSFAGESAVSLELGLIVNNSANTTLKTNSFNRNADLIDITIDDSNFTSLIDQGIQNYSFIRSGFTIIQNTTRARLAFTNSSMTAEGNLSLETELNFNKTFVNSTMRSGLNTTANITLYDLSFDNPQPLVDREDDGNPVLCDETTVPKCEEISYSGGDFTFNVTHFTTFMASETPILASCGLQINQSLTMDRNITCSGTALFMNNNSIFLDCAGFNITSSDGSGDGIVALDLTNITIRNCNIRNYARNINFTNVTNSSIRESNISNNTLVYPGGIGIYIINSLNIHLINLNVSNHSAAVRSDAIGSVGSVGMINITNGYYEAVDQGDLNDVISPVRTENLTVFNATIIGKGTNTLAFSSSLSRSIRFINNSVTAGTGCISVTSVNNSLFERNVFLDCGGEVFNEFISADMGFNLTINNNTLPPVSDGGYVLIADVNFTNFINQPLENYTFLRVGFFTFENSSAGRLLFTNSSMNAAGNLSLELQLGFNRTFVNSTIRPGLNTTANITLYDLSFDNPQPLVDREDDGNPVLCDETTVPKCEEISYSGGDFTFNVTHFTTFMANETPILASCGLQINQSLTMDRNITCSGTALFMNNNSITLNCAGYNITGGGSGEGIAAASLDNLTMINCNIRNFARNVNLTNTTNSSVLSSNLTNASGSFPGGAGIWLFNGSVNTNISNVNASNNSRIGVDALSGINYLNITNSRASVNNGFGVRIANSTNTIIDAVTFNGLSSITDVAVLSVSSSGMQLVRNIIDTFDTGIRLISTNHTLMQNNTISSSVAGAFNISILSYNLTLKNNTLSGSAVDVDITDSNTTLFLNQTFINYTFLRAGWLTFENASARLAFTNDSITESGVNLSSTTIILGFNRTLVNSSLQQGFNTTANITFYGITLNDPQAQVDLEDDGSSVLCHTRSDPKCEEISYSGNTFVFNVTHFTTYSAREALACGDTITESTIMTEDISGNGTCITIEGDHLEFDCAGYSITGNNSDTNGWGVNISGRVNVTVRDCVVTNFSYGIVLYNSSNSTINNNTLINNTGVSGFEGTGIILWNGSSNNTVINNNATGNREGLILERGLDALPNIWGNMILNNTFESNSDAGVILSNADGNNITANEITRNNRNMVVSASEYNVIESNNITNSTVSGGLSISSGDNNFNNITNNQILDNVWFGVNMVGTSVSDCQNRLERNNINGSRTIGSLRPVGIRLECSFGGGGTIIYGNTIALNRGDGIHLLYYGSNINITSNNIINNLDIGINFSVNASFSIIEKNNITNHSIGILIRDDSTPASIGNSSNNSIVNNTIISAIGGVGIKLEVLTPGKSEGNVLRYNNISFGNGTMISNATDTRIENNTFTNNSIGILIQANSISSLIKNNTFLLNNISIYIRDAFNTTINLSRAIPPHFVLENTTSFAGGILNYTNTLNLENGTFLLNDFGIGNNSIFANSTKTPGLNQSAILTLTGLNYFTSPEPIVDREDDGSFLLCNASSIPKCEEISFAGNNFNYNVTHFTTFSSRENTAPGAPVLVLPDNDTVITNRTPSFTWNNSEDNESDQLTYNLVVANDSSFALVNIVINQTSISEDPDGNTTFNAPDPLAVDVTYWWKVRANDTASNDGDFSETWNFTIESLLSINLSRAVVNFVNLSPEEYNDTDDDNPLPFLIENTGNVLANVTFNGTRLFENSDFPGSNYQYRVNGTTSEPDSFNHSESQTTYTNVVEEFAAGQVDIALLNWSNANDEAEIEINITVPNSEPAGQKVSNTSIRAVIAE